jgi:phosphoribosylanthranilate isomerase
MRVKICGITNLSDALAALESGADALGFNFFKGSSRFLEPGRAREIIDQLPPGTMTVGVFVNESTDSVARICEEASIAVVQLHGDESPEFCQQLLPRRLIKAIRGQSASNVERLQSYPTEAILLDAHSSDGWGGTGHIGDWRLARRVTDLGISVFLAGGLTPDNVAQAIELVEPYAVDVCSGVEVAPGRKDHELMRRFISAAKA